MMLHDATVVIPQFNLLTHTRRCCESILATHSPAPRLLIVDDGSDVDAASDPSVNLTAFADVLKQPHRGVTAAWNAGLHACRTRWIIFLNNDTRSLGSWCDQLLAPLRAQAAELAGTGWRTEPHLPPAFAAEFSKQAWLQGWCLAMERTRLLDLGGLDESMSLYFSDTDLQLRLRLSDRNKEPLIAVPGLPLLHEGHATARRLPSRSQQWRKDREVFHQNWSND